MATWINSGWPFIIYQGQQDTGDGWGGHGDLDVTMHWPGGILVDQRDTNVRFFDTLAIYAEKAVEYVTESIA